MKSNKKTVVEIVIDEQDAAPIFNFAFEVGQNNPGPVTIPFRSKGEQFRMMIQSLVNRAVELAIENLTPHP